MAVASAAQGSAARASAYGGEGQIDWAMAKRSVLGIPPLIVGALLSNVVGGWSPPAWCSAS